MCQYFYAEIHSLADSLSNSINPDDKGNTNETTDTFYRVSHTAPFVVACSSDS